MGRFASPAGRRSNPQKPVNNLSAGWALTVSTDNTMKTTNHLITKLFVLFAIALAFLPGTTRAGDLSSHDKQFLAGYEQIRAALAADDLNGAKKAAASLPDSGAALAKSQSLGEARTSFTKLSDEAVKLAAGQPGYHVLHCSMANKDWVQTSATVGNPYLGADMAGCGEIKQ